jgi:Domain of unknown function (DUF4177)
MTQYEYKVIPAPARGEKLRGAKTAEDRLAATLAELMNALGREGWEYVRADTLPCEERVGLTGRKTTFVNMLVFRRVIAASVAPTAVIGSQEPRRVDVGMIGGAAAPALPPAQRVEWPVDGAAPSLGPARPLAAE